MRFIKNHLLYCNNISFVSVVSEIVTILRYVTISDTDDAML